MSRFIGFSEKSFLKRNLKYGWAKYGQWYYRFKFLEGEIDSTDCSMQNLERLEVTWSNQFKFLVFGNFKRDLMQILGRFNLWVTPKTNWPSFCLLLKLSHALLDGLFNVLLGCMLVKINALFAEWTITECDYFQILLLGILSSIEPTMIFTDTYFQI